MKDKIKNSFQKQGLMKTLGAKLILIEQGKVIIECLWSEALSQQHGFFHAGVLTSVVDSACGYAALTHMPGDKEELTVEFKINFIKAASTKKITAIGRVLNAVKTLTICEGEVFDETGNILIAKMTATLISR